MTVNYFIKVKAPSTKCQNGVGSTTFSRKSNNGDEDMWSIGVVALQNVARNCTAESQVSKSGRRRVCEKTDAHGRYDANRETFYCPNLIIKNLFKSLNDY